MYISSLIVNGFRSIDYIHLKFSPGKNVIVGKNNSGKSNIIKALNLIMGDKSPSYNDVTANDFHTIDDVSSNSYWVMCTLKGDDIDETTFTRAKGQWKGKLDNPPFRSTDSSRVEIDSDHALFVPDEYYGSPDKKYSKTWIKGIADLNHLREDINQSNRICILYYVSREDFDDEEFSKDYRIFYQSAIDNTWYCLWNVPNKIRESLLTSAILPAFRDPASQLRINNYTWYGKLLKKAWEAKRNSLYDESGGSDITLHDKLHEAYEQVNSVGSMVYGSLSDEIRSRLDIAFMDIELSFNFFVSKGEVHKQTQVFVNDGFDSQLNEKGSGIQSAILIGLFSYYCSMFHCNTTLLAVEEPELYLHPQARRVISNRLSEFVNLHVQQGVEKQNQVLVTTHSSEFIRAGEIDSISVIRKINNKTEAYNYTIDPGNKKIVQALLKSENSEMFFADKVIICEGGEKHILPHLADFLINKDNILDEKNITIVRANGKGDIIKYSEILRKCNIPFYVLADLDYFFDGLSQELDEEIASLRALGKQLISQEEDIFKSNKEINKRLNPSNNFDAKAFSKLMGDLKNEQCEVGDVLQAWEHIASKITKKITKDLLTQPNMEEFKLTLHHCLQRIWDAHDVYILNYGELEDYHTEKSLQIPGTKETKLLNMIDNITSESPISDFIDVTEFMVFLGKVLDLELVTSVEQRQRVSAE